MDVDITMIVSPSKFWLQDANLSVFLGTLSAELEHLAHGGVTINVSVATLNIGIFLGVELRNGAIGLHELSLRLADTSTLSAVFNISLGSVLKGGLHEDLFDDVLDLLDSWDAASNFILSDAQNFFSNVFGTIMTEFASCGASFCDSLSDFFWFERHDLSIALSD